MAVVVLTACIAPAGSKSIETGWLPEGAAACVRDSVTPVWADSLERAAIGATQGRVRRQGCRLLFQLPGGHEHEIADAFPPASPYMRAAYRGSVTPWALDLVEVTFDEQAGYYLVNRYGTRAFLAGRPVADPSGKRFATASLDLEATYQENIVQIWRVEGDEPTLELAVKSDEWGPSDLVWRDSVTLAFMQNFPTANVGAYRKVSGVIRHLEGRWLIDIAAH